MSEKLTTASIPETERTEKSPVDRAREHLEERYGDQFRELHEKSAAEFLVSFKELKTDVREQANIQLGAVEKAIAQGKNLLSSPKNFVLELRKMSAQRKYDRVSRKLDASRFDFVNKRREAKAAAAYADLEEKTRSHDEHSAMMDGRLERVDTTNAEREEAIEAKRQELAKERLEAIQRKLIRRERAEERKKLESHKEKYTYAEREAAIDKCFSQPAFLERIKAEAMKIVESKNQTVEGEI